MLNNWNTLKAFSRDELLELVPKGFSFKTTPWTHQIAAFIANISNNGFLDALDLGTGKTKVAIDTCRYWDFSYGNKKNIKVLYICLNSAVEKMRDEVITHSDFSAVCLRGNKNEKWKIFSKKYNFYIINYESLRTLITERVPTSKVKYNPDTGEETISYSNKEQINANNIKKLIKKMFHVLIIDESHVIKNPKSLIFRIIKALSVNFKFRNLLTGTPFGNTLLDVWSQYYIVDFGETFSYRFNAFRNSYFEDVGYWGPLWKPTQRGRKEINAKLYSKAIRYSEDECEDLPQKVFRVMKYKLDPKQVMHYEKALEIGFDQITENPKRKAISLREICSGFIGDSNFIFKKNPKLDLLWEIIENIYEKHKAVIFVERTASLNIIEKMLKKNKVKHTSLSGATRDKYKENMKFQNNPNCRVIVANIKSGGASIDLTAASYCIHYEHGGSVINYRQSLKRVHRGGQDKRCFFYSLIGTGTVEVGIYRDLQNGNDAFTGIVDGKQAMSYLKGE